MLMLGMIVGQAIGTLITRMAAIARKTNPFFITYLFCYICQSFWLMLRNQMLSSTRLAEKKDRIARIRHPGPFLETRDFPSPPYGGFGFIRINFYFANINDLNLFCM